ncbi:MAG: RecB family exonuclease [Terriglobia bacterium]
MPIYSHSQLSTFEQCPLKYKLKYIDKVHKPDETGVEAFTGSLVHETLQKLYDDLKYEKLNSVDDLVSFYDGRWRATWTPGVKIVRDGMTQENYRDYGARCIRNYYQRNRPFNQGTTLATELRLSFALDAEGLYRFQGYIDRLARTSDGTYQIHDYKTSNTLPEQAHADRDRQLPLYQIGLQERWHDVEKVDLVWHYVGLDSMLASRRSPEQIDELRQKMIELIRRIESATDFPPVKTALCDWCEYRCECPLWKHVIEIGALSRERAAEDNGWRLASEYAELKAQSDDLSRKVADLRDRIIAYASERRLRMLQGKNACVSVSEREQLMLPSREDAERQEIESLVREMGEWESLSDLSAGRIVNALEGSAWPESQRDQIRALLRVSRTFTVRVKRAGERDLDEGE